VTNAPNREGAIIEKAQDMAVLYHEGQLDKAGQPYYLHALRVSGAGKTTEEQVLEAIHDLLEDTQVAPAALRYCFGDDMMVALAAITREPGESYWQYIERCGRNSLARAVKINDLRDNLGRVDSLPDQKEAEGLASRYVRALKQLGGF
jgi:hypothetical protein